ncbi:hypothetical protein Moror_2393, partial [Moniliophthora roreri MCA 2997]
ILIEDVPNYAEVQYFFLVEKKGMQYTLVAMKMYSEPNNAILKDSVQTLGPVWQHHIATWT